jgi:hypothetical protein
MPPEETHAMPGLTTEPPATPYVPRKAFAIEGSGLRYEEIGRAVATVATGAETAAARVIQAAENGGSLNNLLDVPALAATLRDQAAAVRGGSLGQAETILINQAAALQSLFARLVERGMGSESVPGFEANMRMALRAQAQCRATLETLAEIKNPPVVYARQANVTTGPQQVNNGLPTNPFPRARDSVPPPDKLLEEIDGQRLDTGATSAAGGADPHLAAVGAVDGAAHGNGQGTGRAERVQG